MYERILIVDPDPSLQDELELTLSAEGYALTTASDAEEAFGRIDESHFDLVFCDSAIPGIDGFELISQLMRRLPQVPIILTSTGSLDDLATHALNRGAFDVLVKPVRSSQALLAIRRVRKREAVIRTAARAQRDLERWIVDRPVVAASRAMIEVLEQLERTAGDESPILLYGELGTGREGLARVIHAQSGRRERPFVFLPCAGRKEAELEVELLGGSLSGRQAPNASSNRGGIGRLLEAHHGSLYLDEVVALPLPLQDALLEALQNQSLTPPDQAEARPVDVRIMASSRNPLDHAVEDGRLREDLYKLLTGATIDVPPIRERREDIPLLVDHFLAHFQSTFGKPVRGVADDALERLANYSWPGNLRELQNIVERAVLLADGERITLRELPEEIITAEAASSGAPPKDLSLRRARRGAEMQIIGRALIATDGNRTHAAKLLGISHRALLYKIKEYGIR